MSVISLNTAALTAADTHDHESPAAMEFGGNPLSKDDGGLHGTMEAIATDDRQYVRKLNPFQLRFYNFFERHTTWQAKAFMFVSYLFIFVAVVTLTIATLPYYTSENGQSTTIYNELLPFEVVTGVWWTIELVGRFLGSPEKLMFFTRFINIVDLLSILPSIFIYATENDTLRIVSRILSIMRLLKMVKLARYNVGLAIGARALKRSLDAVAMLLILMALSLLVVCAMMYYAERGTWDEAKRDWFRPDGTQSPFNSIPIGFYWGMATLTTVGYGDAVPITPVGKLVASFTMLLAVMTIALPTSIIGSNFMTEWQIFQRQ